jgi:hypothetical protein
MWGLVLIGVLFIVLGMFIGNLYSDEREARRDAQKEACRVHKHRRTK